MKIFLLSIFFYCLYESGYSQNTEGPFRIFGEISTINNTTYKGFINWGGSKNYWIDFFEASKKNNPYEHFFKDGDDVFFHNDGHLFAKPPVHLFCCRFGNIKSIRLTGEEEILLQLKNGDELSLAKGNSPDINTNIQISTLTETVSIKWEHISEIHFMAADSNAIPPELYQVAGILKSSQGVYKGLVTWDCNKKRSAEKNKNINLFLNKLERIVKDKNIFKVAPKKELFRRPITLKTDLLYPVENIMINMPNIGSVIVPPSQFKEMKIISIHELSLLTYDSFKAPQLLQGEIRTRNNELVTGNLAYDLDENLDIEVLDGKNNNIVYRIPFKYIHSIEPKNYKYSYLTLWNGSQLSLGDTSDVNRENSGIIVSGYGEIPVYIFWSEVKGITFNAP